MKKTLLSTAFVFAASLVNAAEPDAGMVDFVNATARAWFQTDEAQAAIKASNAEHASVSQEKLVQLDREWRDQVGQSDQPLIASVMESSFSETLRAHAEASQGVISEIIVMDNRGMNVALSSVTSDFWQGDEAKYLETYPRGADAMHASDIELDESSQTYQVQVSFTVTDAATGNSIGCVTIGLNAEAF